MKRMFRILIIILNGKFRLLKKISKWIRGQLFRDLNNAAPDFIKQMIKKYGAPSYAKHLMKYEDMGDVNRDFYFKEEETK